MKIFKLEHISSKTETTENMLRTGSKQKIPLIFGCQNDIPKCTKFQKKKKMEKYPRFDT